MSKKLPPLSARATRRARALFAGPRAHHAVSAPPLAQPPPELLAAHYGTLKGGHLPPAVADSDAAFPAHKVQLGLPAGIRSLRHATEDDIPSILRIQHQYALSELNPFDPLDHPSNGWLVQMDDVDKMRTAMRAYKDYWVAVNHSGAVVAYQTVSAPRFFSRPPEAHRFFGAHGPRAEAAIRDKRFLYMSQIATDKTHRGAGVVAALQRHVLAHYHDVPLLAHIAIATQPDWDAWQAARARDPDAPFVPASMNTASCRYHRKAGYVEVAWVSDLADAGAFNSGLPPAPREGPGPPGILGILVARFPDAASRLATPRAPIVDVVEMVLGAPATAGVAAQQWANPFSPHWPDAGPLVPFDPNSDGGSRPLGTVFDAWADELNALRRAPRSSPSPVSAAVKR